MGCAGWGGIYKINGSFARELTAHAQFFLKANAGRNLIHVTAGTSMPECADGSCNGHKAGVVVFRGNTKVAEHYFSKSLETFVFEDEIPNGEKVTDYVLMPQGFRVVVEKIAIQPIQK